MSFEMQSSHLLSLAAFVPQFVLAITAGFLYGKDLVYACFLQTFVFVHFNKVITSQVKKGVNMSDLTHSTLCGTSVSFPYWLEIWS